MDTLSPGWKADYLMCLPLQIIANMTALAWRPEWQSLLANGTVNNPQHNNLTGIVYGEFHSTVHVG